MACMAGGDAIACHNAVRGYVYMFSLAAGLQPEREQPGLLPEDPRRRPGDLYFALWPGEKRGGMFFLVVSLFSREVVFPTISTYF